MADSDTETLKQIFGAYFHQDWMLEHQDDAAVLVTIRQNVSLEDRVSAASALHMLVAQTADETELQRKLVDDLGCYFDPSSAGFSAREWLQQVRQALIS